MPSLALEVAATAAGATLAAVNILLLEWDEVEGGRALLEGRRAAHAYRVLKAAPGAELRVGLSGWGLGSAAVVRSEPEALELHVGAWEPAPPPLPIDLALALPRPKVLARILRDVASAGVRRVHLLNAWKVDKSYFDSPRLTEGALARELAIGCEQGGHPHVPEIQVHRFFMSFMRQWAQGRRENEGAIALDPRARSRLEEVPAISDARPLLLAIGPEGGWIRRELEAFEEVGGVPAALGLPILRSETAPVAALAQVSLLRRVSGGRPPGTSGR